MRKRILLSVAALAGLFGGLALTSGGSSAQALDCPVGALGQVCGAVDVVYSAVCYNPLPQVGTIEFITIQTNGRLLNCPTL